MVAQSRFSEGSDEAGRRLYNGKILFALLERTSHRRIRPRARLPRVALGCALSFLASACGPSTDAAVPSRSDLLGAEIAEAAHATASQSVTASSNAQSFVATLRPPAPLFGRHLRFDAVTRASTSKSALTIDGDLREWTHLVDGAALAPDVSSSLAVALAADEEAFYVAAQVGRGRALAPDERVTVRLRFLENGTSSAPWLVSVHVPAARSGGARVMLAAPAKDGSPLPETPIDTAQATTRTTTDGFSLEARVPWSSLAPSARSRLGLHAAVTYAAGGHERAAVGMSDASETLCPTRVEQDLLARLDPTAKLLWPHAARSWIDAGGDFPIAVDVSGDARFERIGRLGGQVSVCESSDGATGHCEVRDYGPDARVSGVEAKRLTRSGKDDLVVRYWRSVKAAQHEVLEVLPRIADKSLAPVFEHEVGVSVCCGSEAYAPPHVTDRVTFAPGEISVVAEKAWRLDAKKLTEPPLGGTIVPIVTPWDVPSTRRYVWKDRAFVLAP